MDSFWRTAKILQLWPWNIFGILVLIRCEMECYFFKKQNSVFFFTENFRRGKLNEVAGWKYHALCFIFPSSFLPNLVFCFFCQSEKVFVKTTWMLFHNYIYNILKCDFWCSFCASRIVFCAWWGCYKRSPMTNFLVSCGGGAHISGVLILHQCCVRVWAKKLCCGYGFPISIPGCIQNKFSLVFECLHKWKHKDKTT